MGDMADTADLVVDVAIGLSVGVALIGVALL